MVRQSAPPCEKEETMLGSFKKPHRDESPKIYLKDHHPQRWYRIVFKESGRLAIVRTVKIASISSLHAASLAKKNFGSNIEILEIEVLHD